MAPKPPLPTGQELEIMKIVWDLGVATVRDVYERLRVRREIAYATVMMLMRTLERKGHLKVTRTDRTNVYRPVRSPERVLGEMVKEFVDRVFGGAVEPLLQHLVRDRHLPAKQVREIAKQLKASRKRPRPGRMRPALARRS
jgi:BlaI family penicillinase repressor